MTRTEPQRHSSDTVDQNVQGTQQTWTTPLPRPPRNSYPQLNLRPGWEVKLFRCCLPKRAVEAGTQCVLCSPSPMSRCPGCTFGKCCTMWSPRSNLCLTFYNLRWWFLNIASVRAPYNVLKCRLACSWTFLITLGGHLRLPRAL
jgi:hypothetical protein